MSRKLTYEEVKKVFEDQGYELVDKEYISSKSKLKFICHNHPEEVQSITLGNLRKSKHACWKCTYEHRAEKLKVSYEEVESEFKKRGYKLLTNEYLGVDRELRYICLKHPEIEQVCTYRTVRRQSGCAFCKGNRVVNFEVIKKEFEERGYELLENEFVNSQTKMKYRCLKHPEEDLYIRYTDFVHQKSGCPVCGIEKRSGSSHQYWKGGISKLEYFLRHSIGKWKKQVLNTYNHQCFVSGEKGKFVIHHLTPFSEIVEKSLNELGLLKLESVNEYTSEDKVNLKNKIIELHEDIEGVPLTKKVHIDFHNKYGYKGTTLEQLLEFKRDYKSALK